MSIYFIACGGFIKVGYSADPAKRTANLFRSSSRYAAPAAAYEARGTQTLLGHIDGEKSSERALHIALRDYAAGAEWFVDEPELRVYLASLTDDHDDTFLPLTRPTGPAWKSIADADRGGSNVALALQVLARRRELTASP